MADWDGETENDMLMPERSEGSKRPSSKSPEPGSDFAARLGALVPPKLWALVPEAVQTMRMDLLQGAVVRLYYSKFTAFLYLGTLLVSGVLLAVTLGIDTPMRDAPGVLLFLEGLVTFSLFTEVLLRAVVLGREYLRSWPNILDAAIALASASLMFFAAPRASKAEEFEKQKEDVELSQSLVMARTLMQFGRVMLIAEHARRSRQSKSSDDLDFSSLGAGAAGNLDLGDLDFAVLREHTLQAVHRSGAGDGL